MARTAYYMQFSNPALGIAEGVGTTGSYASPGRGRLSDLITELNSGKDVYVNRGGIAAPDLGGLAAENTASSWFTLTSAPTNLGRLLLWDGAEVGGVPSGLGCEPWTVDAGYYDPPATSGAGGWTSIGDGKWTKTFTFSSAPTLRAMWAQAVRGVGIDVTTRLELRQRSSAVNCTAVGDWHQNTSTAAAPIITMQTGGNTEADSPARMMGGLVMAGSSDRWGRAMRLTVAKRLEFDPFQILHGTLRFLGASSSSDVVSDLVFNDFRGWGAAINGIGIFSASAATDHVGGVFRVRFNRADVSTGTRAEASCVDYAAVPNWMSVQHNVAVWGQVGEVSFADPAFFGARHGCIELQSDTTLGADTGYPRNIEFYGTTPGAATINFPPNDPNGYYNAFGVATSGSVTIKNFLIENVTKHAGVVGHARIEGNHWRNFGYAIVPYNPDDNGGIDDCLMFALGTSNGSLTQYDIPTCSIDFCNNIIDSPWNYPFRIVHQWDGLVPDHSLRIVGNTIIDVEHFYEKKTYTQSTAGKTRDQLTASASASVIVSNVSTSGTPGAYMTPQTLQDNLFITPTTSVIAWSVHGSGSAGTVVSGDTVADGTDADSEIVRTGNLHFTTTSAAGLDGNRVPAASSDVVGAASLTTPRLDAAGRVRAIPASVGAKEPA